MPVNTMTAQEHIARIIAACDNECEFELADACNPAAMTAVLAYIDAQAAEIERLRGYLDAEQTGEIERLRDDAARYQWLRKTTNWVSSKGRRIDVRNCLEVWDESIDAAIKTETP